METARRKICIITGTRAEWGLLETIARQLRDRKDTQLQIVATNMHLDPRYGHTVDEIEAGGYRVDARVAMASDDDSRTARIKAMGQCMNGMADAFAALKPDLAVILGDRYEMLAVASAALMSGIPIAHLHGELLCAADYSRRYELIRSPAVIGGVAGDLIRAAFA